LIAYSSKPSRFSYNRELDRPIDITCTNLFLAHGRRGDALVFRPEPDIDTRSVSKARLVTIIQVAIEVVIIFFALCDKNLKDESTLFGSGGA